MQADRHGDEKEAESSIYGCVGKHTHTHSRGMGWGKRRGQAGYHCDGIRTERSTREGKGRGG